MGEPQNMIIQQENVYRVQASGYNTKVYKMSNIIQIIIYAILIDFLIQNLKHLGSFLPNAFIDCKTDEHFTIK